MHTERKWGVTFEYRDSWEQMSRFWRGKMISGQEFLIQKLILGALPRWMPVMKWEVTAQRNDVMMVQTSEQHAPCPSVYQRDVLYLIPFPSHIQKNSHIIQGERIWTLQAQGPRLPRCAGLEKTPQAAAVPWPPQALSSHARPHEPSRRVWVSDIDWSPSLLTPVK